MKRTYTYLVSFITSTVWLFGGIVLHAQENLVESRPVAPAYYGPNAFPIPEMGFGRTCSELSLELGPALALHKGFSIREDATADAYFQNDAPMYGIAAGFSYGCFDISAQYGGYVGWRKDGDSPMSIRVQAKLSVKQLDILMKYQEGLID